MKTLSMMLMHTLIKGKDKLEAPAIERIKAFINTQRKGADCLFNDKRGQEDIYYTSFGLMLCRLFDMKVDVSAVKARLDAIDTAQLDLIHYAAYQRSKQLLAVIGGHRLRYVLRQLLWANSLPEFGSYPNNDAHSPYSQFIRHSLLEDGLHPLRKKRNIVVSLQAYKVKDGGYSNVKSSGQASINATTAALTLIQRLSGRSDAYELAHLANQQEDTGGFRANARAPVPDILTTATALFALTYCQAPIRVNPLDFIEAHWLDSGGFASTLLDDESDVEYTFYGLLALGTCV